MFAPPKFPENVLNPIMSMMFLFLVPKGFLQLNSYGSFQPIVSNDLD